jgi:phosphate transport system substrate-binding protein
MRKILLVGILIVLVGGCSSFEQIVIRGSDTEVNLVLHLAEEFMNEHKEVSIAVTGGGSGTGIASLLNGKTDLANSSRSFLPSEQEMAMDRGLDLRKVVFAMDALCFIVHPTLEINSLKLQDLADIYSGKICNWSELGGPDHDISVYGRQSNSGTFIYIRQELVQAEYSNQIMQMNGTAQIIEAIKKDKSGIGYVGLGYILDHQRNYSTDVKIIPVRLNEEHPQELPLGEDKTQNENYPLVRPLYQYFDGLPNPTLKAFLEFELGQHGQEMITQSGYFKVAPKFYNSNQKAFGNE